MLISCIVAHSQTTSTYCDAFTLHSPTFYMTSRCLTAFGTFTNRVQIGYVRWYCQCSGFGGKGLGRTTCKTLHLLVHSLSASLSQHTRSQNWETQYQYAKSSIYCRRAIFASDKVSKYGKVIIIRVSLGQDDTKGQLDVWAASKFYLFPMRSVCACRVLLWLLSSLGRSAFGFLGRGACRRWDFGILGFGDLGVLGFWGFGVCFVYFSRPSGTGDSLLVISGM